MNFKEFIKEDFKISPNSYLNSTNGLNDYSKIISKIPDLNQNIEIPNSIPKVTKTSTISIVERNKNPIAVILQDGTKLYFTLDQFKRINEEPIPGKKMSITFQRHQKDNSANNSQIDHVLVY